MRIPALEPSQDVQSLKEALSSSDVILDAIFGFSFKPPARPPFDAALPLLTQSGLPIVSVDVPSGWNVDEGKIDEHALEPDVLVSLTAPKEGVRKYSGRHFLGGRFVPKCVYRSYPGFCVWKMRETRLNFSLMLPRTLEEKYQLNLPEYPGFSQIVELPRSEKL